MVEAAERMFVAEGFHATSVDQVAAAAGYTKGAVYSNFSSKEDLFFAVYEARAERVTRSLESIIAEHGAFEGLRRIASDTSTRRGRDDGWLAVFFEFWAHVVRNPPLRERFATIHRRLGSVLMPAAEQIVRERDLELPVTTGEYGIAVNAMLLGLSLERLTRPDEIDVGLGVRMTSFLLGEPPVQ